MLTKALHPLAAVHEYLCSQAFVGTHNETIPDPKLDILLARAPGLPAVYYRKYNFDQNKDTLVIFSPGNQYTLDDSGYECNLIAFSLDCAAVTYEYPRYRDKQTPTDDEVYEAITDVYKAFEGQFDHIILWGRSVGGAPTCFLAAQPGIKYDAVVLQSTFTSALRLAIPNFWIFLFVVDILSNIDFIKEFQKDKPVFIFHSASDEVIPLDHATNLANECRAMGIPHQLKIFPRTEVEEFNYKHNSIIPIDVLFPNGLEEILRLKKSEPAD